MTSRILPEAEQDVQEVFDYYEDKQTGLGFDFLDEFEEAVHAIADFPSASPFFRDGLRRRTTNRFPYGIIYAVQAEEALILSVMHMSRHPDAWKRRAFSIEN